MLEQKILSFEMLQAKLKKVICERFFLCVPYDLSFPTYWDIIKINDVWKMVTEITAILSEFDSCTDNHSSCS